MAVTIHTAGGMGAYSAPYTATANATGLAAGDDMILECDAYEFDTAGGPGTRVMTCDTAGWDLIYYHDTVLFSGSATRRAIFAAWRKAFTGPGSTESATVSLTGATEAYLSIQGRLLRVRGTGGSYKSLGPVAKYGPAAALYPRSSSSPPTLAAGDVGLVGNHRISTPTSSGGSGWYAPATSGTSGYTFFIVGDGPSPGALTYPDISNPGIDYSIVYAPPELLHTGAMSS